MRHLLLPLLTSPRCQYSLTCRPWAAPGSGPASLHPPLLAPLAAGMTLLQIGSCSIGDAGGKQIAITLTQPQVLDLSFARISTSGASLSCACLRQG